MTQHCGLTEQLHPGRGPSGHTEAGVPTLPAPVSLCPQFSCHLWKLDSRYPLNPKCSLRCGPQQGTGRRLASWLYGQALRPGGQEPLFPCSVQATHTEPMSTASEVCCFLPSMMCVVSGQWGSEADTGAERHCLYSRGGLCPRATFLPATYDTLGSDTPCHSLVPSRPLPGQLSCDLTTCSQGQERAQEYPRPRDRLTLTEMVLVAVSGLMAVPGPILQNSL